MGKRLLAFVAALVATYILASIAITQGVLEYITLLGREVSFGERLGAIGHDLIGMVSMLLPIVAVTLLVAFGVVAVVVSRLPDLRLVGYVLGGFVGMVSVYLIMQAVFGMTPVWSARDAFGLTLQGLAGAVGGYLFVRINPRSAS